MPKSRVTVTLEMFNKNDNNSNYIAHYTIVYITLSIADRTSPRSINNVKHLRTVIYITIIYNVRGIPIHNYL